MDFLAFVNLIRDEIQRQSISRSRRQLRDISNPFSAHEACFKKLYRISKETAHFILVKIGPYMVDSQRTTCIPKALRMFAALQFIAQGSYQKSVGQDFFISMSQCCVSRCITEVTNLISTHLAYLVHFPNTNAERIVEKEKFQNMNYGFPGIIGCIDGTHVAIIGPKFNNPEKPGVIYYCRKGFYSLNVQIICNAELVILSINARFPGSAHDAAIWQMSQAKTSLRENYENGDRHTYLLGDSGYALEPWLMTPILRPENDQERRYNVAHKSIRNIVERCIGVLKQRFRCLFRHRVLNYSPTKAGKIIYTCAILHNLCMQRNEGLDDYDDSRDNNEEQHIEDINNEFPDVLGGFEMRRRVINQYF